MTAPRAAIAATVALATFAQGVNAGAQRIGLARSVAAAFRITTPFGAELAAPFAARLGRATIGTRAAVLARAVGACVACGVANFNNALRIKESSAVDKDIPDRSS